MPVPTAPELIEWQTDLEQALAHMTETDLRRATARISDPTVHSAAAAYLTRPSKRLLGMAFLHAVHSLGHHTRHHRDDLIAVAASLEIRHGAILLHDDIADGDTMRGGHFTAHRALVPGFGTEAGSAALFAGDILAGLAPLPILRSGLGPALITRLTDTYQYTTALVAAGQTQQLHLDTRQDALEATEADILQTHSGHFVPYLLCSLQLAAILASLDHATVESITDAGTPLCQGFQVQNDLAGYTELARILAKGESSDTALSLANTSDLARRRRTIIVRTALDRLAPPDRQQLAEYLAGAETDLATICALLDRAGVTDHCTALITELHAQAGDLISTDQQIPAEVRSALAATFGYMTALYDPASPTSRLYLQARRDLAPVAL